MEGILDQCGLCYFAGMAIIEDEGYKDNHFDFIEHSWHHTVCFIAMQTLDAALPIFSGTIK